MKTKCIWCGWSYLGYFFLFWNEFRSFFLVWHCWNQLFPTREGIWCWSGKSISTYGFINQIQPKSCLQKQPTWIQSSIPTKLNKNDKKVFFGLIKIHGKHVCYKTLLLESRGIASSSFSVLLEFLLLQIHFPLWYKTEFPRYF